MGVWFKVFWAKIDQDAKDIWNDSKVFFIIFAIIIAIVKFRQVLVGILVSGGKSKMEDTQKKDTVLAAQEAQANTAADKLVEQAKEEPAKETAVNDDWNLKK